MMKKFLILSGTCFLCIFSSFAIAGQEEAALELPSSRSLCARLCHSAHKVNQVVNDAVGTVADALSQSLEETKNWSDQVNGKITESLAETNEAIRHSVESTQQKFQEWKSEQSERLSSLKEQIQQTVEQAQSLFSGGNRASSDERIPLAEANTPSEWVYTIPTVTDVATTQPPEKVERYHQAQPLCSLTRTISRSQALDDLAAIASDDPEDE